MSGHRNAFHFIPVIEQMIFYGIESENAAIYTGVIGVFFFFGLFGEVFGSLLSKEWKYKNRTSQIFILALKVSFYTFHLIIGYFVMLALMSYNSALFISIVLGHLVGYIFFSLPHLMNVQKIQK